MSEDAAQRGYFSPESAVWRIARESVLMLGGGYALLMQAAHPLVAAGIVAGGWRRVGKLSRAESNATERSTRARSDSSERTRSGSPSSAGPRSGAR